MNFLAHLYLSFPDEDLMMGNFIGDAVKGNPENLYSGRLLEGIRMHRRIDHFTDTHKINKEFNAFLRPSFGRYSGVVSDILHDHFLAANWPLEMKLEDFARDFYAKANSRLAEFPPKVNFLLPYMTEQNWLLAYQSVEGIGRICRQMHNRIKIENQLHQTQTFLEDNYEAILSYSKNYFPHLEKEFLVR